jgi:ubiquinone/menaquinone biosynthesis C-methylase UbiE
MKKTESTSNHKKKIDNLYKNTKYENAIDLYASFFAKSEDDIIYQHWRCLDKKRQTTENSVWIRYIKNGFNVLDIACGNGYYLKRINETVQNNITHYGLDISSEIINVAKEYFPLANFIVSSAEDIPFQDNQFDYIQITSALEHVMSPGKVIEEAVRLLKPDGILYVVVHKRAIDPLILPMVCQFIKYKFSGLKNKLTKLFSNNKYNEGVKYSIKLSDCRTEAFNSLHKSNMVFMEKGFLGGYVESSFYQFIGFSSNWLIRISKLADLIPFSIFKHLEYYVYRKER